MLKNVASQVIGAQMVSATDGSAFTGSVSVAVTVDGGTQGAGTETAPAHEGNGYHTYGPSQTETNGNLIAFTFTGTGAIPVTVQVYTDASYDRLGAPAGASVSADVAAVKSDTAALPSASAVRTEMDANSTKLANLDVAVSTRNATTPPAVGAIADAVCDEALAGHTTAGSVGKALADVLEDTGTTLPAAIPSAATNASTLLAATADGVAVSEILTNLLSLCVGGKFTYDSGTGVLERFAQDGVTSLGQITLTTEGGTPV